ncbi:hypothetical protein F511_19274 [Dorcoceras hygrometricum]|uniref:Uncharacterized protein n=1 Tax=Dorcoceras hygrometricum TaxID=472368 RepID=A0A2Z7D6U0_9LAMI|nr:hypothetical protein F511_19274 [Dorcoceras hygrometricum]
MLSCFWVLRQKLVLRASSWSLVKRPVEEPVESLVAGFVLSAIRRCLSLRLVFGEMLRLDDVSGTKSFELVATLRFEVATGTSREKRCVVLFLRLDTQLLSLLVLYIRRLGLRFVISFREALPIRTSFRSWNWLVEEREVAAVRVLRRFGRAAIPHSHLPAGIVATMSRVVNYHSSWARQQQVELFNASGSGCSIMASGSLPHYEHTPWPLFRCR